jgi:hypothetical protein
MERFQTALELRTRLRSLIGSQSSDALSGQATPRHKEYIRLAHDEVIIKRQWRTSEREHEFTFGIAQRYFNYPSNCRGQNVLSVSVWSNGEDQTGGGWLPLRKRPIGPELNTLPLEAEGGDVAAASRSMPSRWQPMDQLEVWPLADIPYLGLMKHTVSPDLLQDTDVTVVDAIAVLHIAIAMAFRDKKNFTLADANEAKGINRCNLLNAWQHSGEIVHIDDDAAFDDFDTLIDPLKFAERRPG